MNEGSHGVCGQLMDIFLMVGSEIADGILAVNIINLMVPTGLGSVFLWAACS